MANNDPAQEGINAAKQELRGPTYGDLDDLLIHVREVQADAEYLGIDDIAFMFHPIQAAIQKKMESVRVSLAHAARSSDGRS